MIFDSRGAMRFAFRAIGLAALLAIGAIAGLALAWRWPFNFLFGACGLVFLGYCIGRVHEADIAMRPTNTITSLPSRRRQ